MSTAPTSNRERNEIVQLSVFMENKVGRLNELIGLLAKHEIHVMAISTVDTTDCGVTRLIVDYSDQAKELLKDTGFQFNETHVLAVEILTEQDLFKVTAPLVAAEVNIHYIYPMLVRPGGRSALILHMEDNEFAAEILRSKGITVLDHNDIAR